MKYIFALIFFIYLFVSCKNDTKPTNFASEQKEEKLSSVNSSRSLSILTDIEFNSKILDMGEVCAGDTTLQGTYFIKNIGKNSLLIEYVNPECSCTGFKFTEEKIEPGEVGEITLSFNIKNRFGPQKLYAIVKANTESKFYKLTLQTNIISN